MKKLYLLAAFLYFAVLSVFAQSVPTAQWEQLCKQSATLSVGVAPDGTLLMADFLFDQTGGIYYSDDRGTTWTKSDAPDYNYSKFIVFDDYIFALGCSGYVARSADNGHTWSTMYYGDEISDAIGAENVPYTVCYAGVVHDNKLYIGDFSGGGVLFTEDYGETWQMTDLASVSYQVEEDWGDEKSMNCYVENFYNLVSFKGKLYAFGVYFVFRLNEETGKWEVLRDDSNFMSQAAIMNDKLYVGRSVMSNDENTPFVEVTSDGDNWTPTDGRAEGVDCDNNVRALASDKGVLYCGLQWRGTFFSADEGATWMGFTDGLPAQVPGEMDGYFLSSIQFAFDEDYVYLAVYDTPYSNRTDSGVYRYPKQSLSSISTTTISESAPLYTEVFDLSGRLVGKSRLSGKTLNAKSVLPTAHGTYIYKTTYADGTSKVQKIAK